MSPLFWNGMTLGEARDKLRTLAAEGHECPCCRQYVKVYRRKLTAASTRAVIAHYSESGRDWGHLPTIVKKRMPDVAHQGGYMNLAVHWGLIEEERTLREDGGRAGFWRVTEAGEQWVRGEISIPKYALIYDGRRLGVRGDAVTIRDALGNNFDYQELMVGA